MKNTNITKHFNKIIKAHLFFSKTKKGRFRISDPNIPYSIHPIWCAATILTEELLPENLKTIGFLTLLYHDILEDTTILLPEDLPNEVIVSVKEMSFDGGWEEEKEKLFAKSKKVLLFKLYDKVSNLLDSAWMSKNKKKEYCKVTLKLAKIVQKEYGELNIIKMAKNICLY